MKSTLLKSTLGILMAIFVTDVSAQISGPTVVCPGVNYTYSIGDVPQHASWAVTNGTIVSRSGTIWTSQSIVVSFTASGSVTINIYNQNENGGTPPWIFAQAYTTNVSMPSAGYIAGGGSVCPSSTFTLQSYGTGDSFYWQSSPSGQNNWSTFTTTGQLALVSTSITQNKDFRLVSASCPSLVSSVNTVTVFTGITSPGSISGTSTICYGYSPATIQEVTPASSSGGSSYQWQSRVNSGGWVNIGGATSYNYSPGALYQTTDFQRVALWQCNSGQTMTSNIITVSVNPTSQGGNLSSSNGTTFCNSNTISLNLSGYTGNVIGWYYQYNDGGGWSGWNQFSTANSSTNSISLGNNGSANRSYQFYAQVQSGVCVAANSTTLGATVYRTTAAGTLGVNQSSMCSSGSVSLTVSGNYGTITRYMVSTQDNGGAWSGWSYTTSAPSLSTSAGINRNYAFQAFVQNGNCAEVSTNTVYTMVYAQSTGGSLSSTNGISFCGSGTINLNLSGYTGSPIIWYYQYNDGGGWSTWTSFGTPSSTSNSLALSSNGSTNRSYQFYAQVQNGSCGAANSTTVQATVYPNSPGTINPALVESFSAVSSNFTVSGFTSIATLLWQQSTDGINWTSAPGTNNSSTYNFGASSTTTNFRVQVSNGSCVSYSPVLPVIISQVPVISSPSNPAYLAIGNSVTLNASTNNGPVYYSYQWVKAGTDIPGANGPSYVATAPAAYTVRVKSSSTSPSSTSSGFNVYGVGLQPDNSVNALVTTVIRQPGVNENTNLYTLPNTGFKQSVQYLDVLSRPLQTVAIGQSPLQKDIVQPYAYDSLVPTSYLPYVANTKDGSRRLTALNNGGYTGSDQYSFYQHTDTKTPTSIAPYAKTVYDNSPLSRVIEQGAPGTDWQIGTGGSLGAHTVKPFFHTNNSTFKVRAWTTAGPTGYYAANVLGMNRLTDENGNPVMKYTDKVGRTILKRVKTNSMPDTTTWLETYYVYDTRGNLAMQVPPKVSALLNGGTAWTTTLRDQWCFVYTYDMRNRLVQKQVPGSAIAYYVYDPLGRLVLTQDGNLRATNQWAFVKYDIKGRAVMTGVYTNTTQTTLNGVQGIVNALYPDTNTPWYEDRGTILHGYTNQSFPATNADGSALQILNASYYDNYDFDYNGTDDYSYTPQGISGEGAQGNSFGLATGSKRLVMGTSNWLYTYQFYDRFGRAIQTRGNNHLSLAIDNLTTIVYDFEGKVLQTKTYHNAGGTNQYTVVQKNNYDFAGRLTQVSHNVNGAPTDQVVAQYRYNELGQVVAKGLHQTSPAPGNPVSPDPAVGQPGVTYGTNVESSSYNSAQSTYIASGTILLKPNFFVPSGNTLDARIGYSQQDADTYNTWGTFMQTVDYRYNIRGWLSSINNAQLANDGGLTNGDTNDYFGMELAYNTAAGTGNSQYYNGNIGAIKWKSAGLATGVADQRSYNYAYDKSDKLTAATFQANNGTGWTAEQNTLNETMAYDHNGNILSLVRNQNLRGLSGASITSTPQTIDNLAYTYASGNQLSKVADASGDPSGFNDGANQTTEYTYNTNGNLATDQNKGIGSIAYNVLGKAQQINFTNGNIVAYTYDAMGNKLTMVSTVGGVPTTTNYAGGFVYNTNGGTSALNFFSSPEGRVVKNAGGNFEYQYAITDHLGNTRVLFTSAAPTPVPSLANFEGDANDQPTQFQNYGHISAVHNHTAGGANSQYLNGGYAGVIGVAKSYKVMAGDKLQIEAYGSYNPPNPGNSSVSGFATMLLGIFNLPAPVAGEVGTPSAGLTTWGNLAAGGYGDGSTDNDDPKAFVNIVLFDKNYKFLDVAYAQLKGTSLYYMTQSYTVKEAGYAYLYVSNEQTVQTDVYFDDVKMTYTPSNILQSNEYYPFGLQTANSWTRDNTINNFLANGGTELNTTSALYDLQYRNYDPALGRMNQIDPMADKYGSHSVYNYAFNNPVSINDPNGADPPGYRNPYINWHMDADHEGPRYSPSPVNTSLDPGLFGDYVPGSITAMYAPMEYDAMQVNMGQMSVDDYASKYKDSEANYWLVYHENENSNGSISWRFSLYYNQTYWKDAVANFSSTGVPLGFGVYKNGYGADYWWNDLASNSSGNGSGFSWSNFDFFAGGEAAATLGWRNFAVEVKNIGGIDYKKDARDWRRSASTQYGGSPPQNNATIDRFSISAGLGATMQTNRVGDTFTESYSVGWEMFGAQANFDSKGNITDVRFGFDSGVSVALFGGLEFSLQLGVIYVNK